MAAADRGLDGLNLLALSGADIAPAIPELARLRVTVFREYPYLYEGSAGYEAGYLQTYLDCPQSLVLLVRDGEAVVGASSALPLAAELPELRLPFERAGLRPDTLWYLAESVLLPAYRGRGLGRRFFELREARARELGGFQTAAFCAVERPDTHPARPAAYRPPHALWTRQGYTRHPELQAWLGWPDLGETADTPKPMVFWLKTLT